MERARWIIASSGGVNSQTLSDEQRKGFIGLADFNRICRTVAERTPEYLVTDVIMPGGDACALAKRIGTAKIDIMPIMLALVPDGMMDAAEMLTKGAGIHALARKPVTGAQLDKMVEGADITNRLARNGTNKGAIARILWKIGFSPAVRGCEFALSAIDLVSRDPRAVRSMSTSLYPAIARIYDTDVNTVESSMRRAMESAWSSGSAEAQYKLFGNSIDARKGKPTLAELFACIAERLYSGMEIDI